MTQAFMCWTLESTLENKLIDLSLLDTYQGKGFFLNCFTNTIIL